MKYHKQSSIDLMGDTLQELLLSYASRGDVATVKCIHDEWIVDGQDPEDGDYEFLFLNELCYD